MSTEETNEENRITAPAHIAIIMDGNGRWAQRQGMPRVMGHAAGVDTLEEIVRACSDAGVKYLTVYAFSTENWKRPEAEVNGIFEVMVDYLKKEVPELIRQNVRMQAIGDWEEIPEAAAAGMRDAAERTSGCTGLVFSVALNYGSRREITEAVRSIAADYAEGREGLPPAEKIDETFIASRLYTADMPDPDLIIRTGGEKRISNFLLWQCAYSEFIFSDVLWPDFSREELMKCIEEYGGRHRRFGGLDKK